MAIQGSGRVRRRPSIRISDVAPQAAIPGGLLEVGGTGFAGTEFEQPNVVFGQARGRLIACSGTRLTIRVPDRAAGDQFEIRDSGRKPGVGSFRLGQTIARDVHPVANPAIDAEGAVYTTHSGERGKKTAVSVYKLNPRGDADPFLTGIVNATGLLFLNDGTLLVSSRHEGTVYTASPRGEISVFAEGMGVATGLAVDSAENVYVGDRSGTVFKISKDRKIYVFATLEPSVAAYHMTVGPDGDLYVTGPTTSSFESIHRIDPSGAVHEWHRGFGRPQGLAFDDQGHLHVCASFRGRRGVFRVTAPDAEPELIVAGSGIVGLAFDQQSGGVVLATGRKLHFVSQVV